MNHEIKGSLAERAVEALEWIADSLAALERIAREQQQAER